MSLFGSIVPQLGHRSGVRAEHDRAADWDACASHRIMAPCRTRTSSSRPFSWPTPSGRRYALLQAEEWPLSTEIW